MLGNLYKQKIPTLSYQDFLYVARDGFEPPQTEPKSVVLPLDDRAKTARWVTTGAQK